MPDWFQYPFFGACYWVSAIKIPWGAWGWDNYETCWIELNLCSKTMIVQLLITMCTHVRCSYIPRALPGFDGIGDFFWRGGWVTPSPNGYRRGCHCASPEGLQIVLWLNFCSDCSVLVSFSWIGAQKQNKSYKRTCIHFHTMLIKPFKTKVSEHPTWRAS